jgi:hypothetical protein
MPSAARKEIDDTAPFVVPWTEDLALRALRIPLSASRLTKRRLVKERAGRLGPEARKALKDAGYAV